MYISTLCTFFVFNDKLNILFEIFFKLLISKYTFLASFANNKHILLINVIFKIIYENNNVNKRTLKTQLEKIV